jgi:hypothetical protein
MMTTLDYTPAFYCFGDLKGLVRSWCGVGADCVVLCANCVVLIVGFIFIFIFFLLTLSEELSAELCAELMRSWCVVSCCVVLIVGFIFIFIFFLLTLSAELVRSCVRRVDSRIYF